MAGQIENEGSRGNRPQSLCRNTLTDVPLIQSSCHLRCKRPRSDEQRLQQPLGDKVCLWLGD